MKRSSIIVVTFYWISFVLLTSACSSSEEEKKEVIRPVRYQEVLPSGGKRTRTFSGASKAGVSTRLSFKVSGNIQRKNVKVGQRMKAGDLIAALDPADYRVQYEEADAAVKNADAQEDQARSNFERISILYENQNASLSDYEAARSSYQSAQANEKAAKQRRKLSESQLSYTRLYAPIDGVITEVRIDENENVSVGQIVAVLDSGEDPEVEVSIPDAYIANIRSGDKAAIRFPAVNDKMYEGTVTEVGFSTGSRQATYPVTLNIDDPDDQIRPGMAAESTFTFVFEGNQDRIVVPTIAVAEDQTGKFVFVATPSEEEAEVAYIERKVVNVGNITNEGIEINDGLETGDFVVTAGVSRIQEGMKVKLLQ